jgi:hypothetical protein
MKLLGRIRGPANVVPAQAAGRVIVLLVLAATVAPPLNAGPPLRGRRCEPIKVSSPDQPRARARYSAAKTLDLQFRLRLRNTDEERHLVSLRVFTPRGHLYQEVQLLHRGVQGRPVSDLSAELPVAGTAIATNGLFGSWRVEPYLDGGGRPCAVPTTFTIVR